MKYGNVYRILIIVALAAIVLSLSMRFFRRNPEENKSSIAAQTETAIESEDALTAETEKSQETMAAYPDEVEAEGGIRSQKCILRGKKRSMQHVILQIQKAQLM